MCAFQDGRAAGYGACSGCDALLGLMHRGPFVSVCVLLSLCLRGGAQWRFVSFCRYRVCVHLGGWSTWFGGQRGFPRVWGQLRVWFFQGGWSGRHGAHPGCEVLLGVVHGGGAVVPRYVMLCLWLGGGGAQ